jgi:uncharacterized protein
MKRQKALLLLLVLVVIGLSVAPSLVHALTEWWWFDSVGFTQVFWTRLGWQMLLGSVTFVVYSLFLWGNFRVAFKQTQGLTIPLKRGRSIEAISQVALQRGAVILIGFTAFIAAAISASAWETVLKFLNATRFGEAEPVFREDISFYVFALPFFGVVRNWLLGLLILGLGVSALIYGLQEAVNLTSERRMTIPRGVRTHLQLLLAGMAGLVAWSFWLARYTLLLSGSGSVFGAGFTDTHARLLGFQVLSLLAAAIAALLVVLVWRRRLTLLWWGVGLWLVAALLLLIGYPWFQQQFFVKPNELAKETPYLTHNIRFTQRAYGLQAVQRQNFAANTQVTRQSLQNNPQTIDNIRLWDYRPLLSTYRQLQEIRLYYHFQDVDVDRYRLQDKVQQVMLSARELVVNQLPSEARTWVNQHLKYTHGYGAVMNAVNRVNTNGLPELYLKDIPPVSTVNLPITQPAIYYGEVNNPYIVTNTTTPEFDYPQGSTNAVTTYQGKGGVKLSSFWQRLAYAYDQGSWEILMSNYLTPQSRIHYHRAIGERIRQVAPFLRFDSDPYIAVINGRLQWLVDAYTVSNRYPYSQPVAQSKDTTGVLQAPGIQNIVAGNVNYIRNSVKVLVDAYDGTLRFFVVDAQDPVIQTYQKIFPKLFEPATAMSADVRGHLRYPADLFTVQAQMYLTYHMADPEVFYNREDLWRFPIETLEGRQGPMQPYYVIMRLPGATTPRFMLILPFTPANKDNMIAWLAADTNGEQDTPAPSNLLLYEFPKQKLVFGPRQIEARIDQEPSISQQFTLWNQSGSKVIRGDLIVVPIDQSLMYVEPIYLRAEQGELPELKRVIVADGEKVIMSETFTGALASMFGESPITATPTRTTPTGQTTLAQQALATFQKAQTALKQGNWAEYGRYQQELEQVLQQLSQQTNPPTNQPANQP